MQESIQHVVESAGKTNWMFAGGRRSGIRKDSLYSGILANPTTEIVMGDHGCQLISDY